MIQTKAGGQESWVSATDLMNLLALNLTLFAELTVLTFIIWLLFRGMTASAKFPWAGNQD